MSERRVAVAEFVGFVVLALVSKAVLDPFIWRYSGPVSLLCVIAIVALYMRKMG